MFTLPLLLGLIFGFIATFVVAVVRSTSERNKPSPMLEANSRPRSLSQSAFGANTAGIKSSRSTNWQQVPEGQRGVCFFTGRPYPLSELTPVTVDVNGRPRRVLASPEALAELNAGREPHIMAFFVQDHYVPWFAYPDYNPYGMMGGGNYAMQGDYPPMSGIEAPYWEAPPEQQNGDWGGDYTITPEAPAYQDYAMETAAQPPQNSFSQPNNDGDFALDPSYVERDALPDMDPLSEPDISDEFDRLSNTGGDLNQYETADFIGGDNETVGDDVS